MVRALVLGAVQGLTEFVPVSSSAHLVLVPFLLRWPIPSLALDVSVHLGTALAVVAYFWRDLVGIVLGVVRTAARRAEQADRDNARLAVLLVVASVPAAVAGFLLEGLFEEVFASTEEVDRIGAPLTGVFLLVTAGLLVAAEAVYSRSSGPRRELRDVTLLDALLVGAFQAIALAPGISRSGATISAGVFRGLSREGAARFSFLLGLPAILGAGLIAVPDVPADADWTPILVASAAAAVVGLAAIALLLRYLRTRTLRPFALYCVLAAAVALGFWFQIR